MLEFLIIKTQIGCKKAKSICLLVANKHLPWQMLKFNKVKLNAFGGLKNGKFKVMGENYGKIVSV